jgi:hypothetical protein
VVSARTRSIISRCGRGWLALIVEAEAVVKFAEQGLSVKSLDTARSDLDTEKAELKRKERKLKEARDRLEE